jgi:hypothetical protein
LTGWCKILSQRKWGKRGGGVGLKKDETTLQRRERGGGGRAGNQISEESHTSNVALVDVVLYVKVFAPIFKRLSTVQFLSRHSTQDNVLSSHFGKLAKASSCSIFVVPIRKKAIVHKIYNVGAYILSAKGNGQRKERVWILVDSQRKKLLFSGPPLHVVPTQPNERERGGGGGGKTLCF